MSTESPIACRIGALSPADRERRASILRFVAAHITDVEELDDGYAVVLSWNADLWTRTAEFLIYERECCPFLDIALEAGREAGPIRVRLTGREGVKPFIKMELGSLVGEHRS